VAPVTIRTFDVEPKNTTAPLVGAIIVLGLGFVIFVWVAIHNRRAADALARVPSSSARNPAKQQSKPQAMPHPTEPQLIPQPPEPQASPQPQEPQPSAKDDRPNKKLFDQAKRAAPPADHMEWTLDDFCTHLAIKGVDFTLSQRVSSTNPGIWISSTGAPKSQIMVVLYPTPRAARDSLAADPPGMGTQGIAWGRFLIVGTDGPFLRAVRESLK
jgi:hypothetical protein